MFVSVYSTPVARISVVKPAKPGLSGVPLVVNETVTVLVLDCARAVKTPRRETVNAAALTSFGMTPVPAIGWGSFMDYGPPRMGPLTRVLRFSLLFGNPQSKAAMVLFSNFTSATGMARNDCANASPPD